MFYCIGLRAGGEAAEFLYIICPTLFQREDGALTRDGLRQELETHRETLRIQTELIVARGLRLLRPPEPGAAAPSGSVVGEDDCHTWEHSDGKRYGIPPPPDFEIPFRAPLPAAFRCWFEGTTFNGKTVRPYRELQKLLPPGNNDQYLLWRNVFGDVNAGTTYDEFVKELMAKEPLLFSHPRFRGHHQWAATTWGKYFKPAGGLPTKLAAKYDAAAATKIKVGTTFQKMFDGVPYEGKVLKLTKATGLYQVTYLDGDSEEMTLEELRAELDLTNETPTNAEPAELDLTNELPKQKAKKNVGKPRASKRKAASCSDTTRKSARTESSASWPSGLGALVGLSTGHGSRRPLSTCCVCGETCETVYKCNGCGLDLHVVCGRKDERPGSTSSQAWCQSGNVSKKCYPPGKCPDFVLPLNC